MCANCVAQGAVYVGGATVALRGMGYRARRRRLRHEAAEAEAPEPVTTGGG
jgi:hypothetical protein